ncbi:MAG: response regulator [Variovorax paradoxus]|nr:MAG: response regulator [Variovorax paradoxus]PZQ01356.1 MAG: response regulator [Variovorax paradoxus]
MPCSIRRMDRADAPLVVFLVEDNALIRDNLIVALEELVDMRVVAWAESEGDAAEWLRAHPDGWQLAVIDLFLREGSGLGVLEACRARNGRQRAVVLTNYADVDIRAQCLALGADAVFDKSTELDAFLEFCES